MPATMMPDLATRDHPDSDDDRVARAHAACGEPRREELRGEGQHAQADEQHHRVRVGERAQVNLEADEREEEGREEGVERRHLLLDGMLVLGLGHDQAREERADDRRQTDLRGQRREAEAEEHGRQQRRLGEARRVAAARGRAARSCVPPSAKKARKPIASAMTTRIEPTSTPPLGRHADRDREQQHREDVVDHRRAEDRPRRARSERSEVDQHRGRDADARRDERGADEDAGLGRLAEHERRAPKPATNGHDHAARRRRARRSARPARMSDSRVSRPPRTAGTRRRARRRPRGPPRARRGRAPEDRPRRRRGSRRPAPADRGA